MKFLVCDHCKNLLGYVEDHSVPVKCCGEEMKVLVPGSVDAASEKHVPVIAKDGNKVTVTVGSVEHPMTEEHFIAWVALETAQGNQRKPLDGKPVAEFMLCDGDEVKGAFAYCNLHGLWKC